MTSTITHLTAQEHVNDLLRDAERARRHVDVPRPRPRRITFKPRCLHVRRTPRTATA